MQAHQTRGILDTTSETVCTVSACRPTNVLHAAERQNYADAHKDNEVVSSEKPRSGNNRNGQFEKSNCPA